MHKSGKPIKRYMQIIADGASFLVIKTIRLYQKMFSPDHGPAGHNPTIGCRYYPSCSEYTIRAIQERGLFTGTFLGAWRILRCNPLSPGGVDESYKKKQ